MHAGDRAEGRAGFLRHVFPPDVFDSVIFQRLSRKAALLRTVVHQAVLANIEIARAGAATPIAGAPVGDAFLEIVDPGEVPLLKFFHLDEYFTLTIGERAKLAVTVVDNADGGGEAQFHGPLTDNQRVFRVANPAAQDRVDVDVKIGVFSEKLQLFVENFEAFFRDLVGHDVIDTDLEVIQASIVKPLDAVRRQKITVRDEARQDSVLTDSDYDFIQVGME